MTVRTTDHPLPGPPDDGLVGEFFEWHRRGELRVQRCATCATFVHPPQPTCGRCGSTDMEWQRVTGTGAVFTWAVTHRSFHPMFADEVPYIAAIVTLDEGPRLLTMLREVDADGLVAGLRVAVDFEARDNGATVAVFVPNPLGGAGA